MRRRKQVATDSTQDYSQASHMGLIRLGVLVGFPFLWMLADYLFYRFIQQRYSLLEYGTIPPNGFRYFWFPVIVLALALLTGARYIHHAYDLSTVRVAFDYLANALFTGLGTMPVITVSDGKVAVEEGEENLVRIIGGPAFVNVFPGNVVLVENMSGSVRVFGGGAHFISRLETIKETLYLEDRSARIEKMVATSKDGIPVEAHDIQYRYRLAGATNAQEASRRTPTDPYPFSEEAVKAMVYNRNITATGVAPWHTGVNGIVDSTITDFIRSQRLDQLLAPTDGSNDARSEIYEKFKSPAVVGQFRSRGAELLWVGIGHFEAAESKVGEQLVSTWQTRWMGYAERDRTFGDAQRLALQDLGRADAQAFMFLNILEILEDVSKQRFSSPELQTSYLGRVSLLLKGLARDLMPPPVVDKSKK